MGSFFPRRGRNPSIPYGYRTHEIDQFDLFNAAAYSEFTS
jgi:hypothetical protein